MTQLAPKADETETAFMERYLADAALIEEFADESARIESCMSVWEASHSDSPVGDGGVPVDQALVGDVTRSSIPRLDDDVHKNGGLPHVRDAIYATPWAILPEKLSAIVELVEFKAGGGVFTDQQISDRVGALHRPTARTKGAVAVLPLFGVISQRANLLTEFSGGTSTEKFTKLFRQAVADPGVKAIVINIDSPGGGVFGVEELTDEIFKARQTKHIVAVANSMSMSAAYWVAASADEIVVTPSGQIGSIGVFAVHTETSKMDAMLGIKSTLIRAGKFKAEGNEFEPLSDEARDARQALVDSYFDSFVKGVARGRGVSVSAVRNGFGEGRVVNARDAVTLGMADRVGTLDQVLAKLLGTASVDGIAASHETAEALEALDPIEQDPVDGISLAESPVVDRRKTTRRRRLSLFK